MLDGAEDWLGYWKKNLAAEGFNPLDTLAVGYVISSHGFQCDRLGVRIEQCPDDTGAAAGAPPKPYLLVDPSFPSWFGFGYFQTSAPVRRECCRPNQGGGEDDRSGPFLACFGVFCG